MLGGCAAHPKALTLDEARTALGVQAQTTTREELLVRFGKPSATFENGQLVTYRLRVDDRSGFSSVGPAGGVDGNQGWGGVHYSLVVLLDPGGRVREYNLVPVR